MPLPTIFDLCTPRPDVLAGTSSDSDFAADLSRVIRKAGPAEYSNPVLFFANTFPTRGLKNLLANVCARLSGSGGAVSAIFRLDTTFGGGKTHGLIALVHAARGMTGVANPSEFISPTLLPTGEVRVAVFDGENADPANGRNMGDGVLAYTPWGEIAYALASKAGYDRVRKSDEEGIAPGADTLAELFGGQPTLILLDELSIYLRKVRNRPHAKDQLTAFLTSLFKAVESSPNAALVYTLAVGSDGRASDAYSEENQFIADKIAEAESVSARKATLLNPTEDDETAQVLRRRLFGRIDDAAAAPVIDAYRATWSSQKEALAPIAQKTEIVDQFKASYPFHPEVLETLTSKTATLSNFQRVRGMLRILGRTVARVWAEKPMDASAIHLHHIDPGYNPIMQEITTRLNQSAFVPAIRNDIESEAGRTAVAQDLDDASYKGMAPYATYVARTIFINSLAFNEQLQGVTPDRIRYSVLSPETNIDFIEDARKKFFTESAYLDDRPGAPMRFRAQANLTQLIRREEGHVDPGEIRAQLNDRIKTIFSGPVFDSYCFPGGPWDVPDEIGSGKPILVVLSSDALSVGSVVDSLPKLISDIFQRKGSEGGSIRIFRNNLAFVVADEQRVDEMRRAMAKRLALRELKAPDRLRALDEHQQAKVRELEAKSETEVAIAIQQAFRHLFYPDARSRLGGGEVPVAHTALNIHSASERPGSGQQEVVRSLRDLGRLRTDEDEPDSPAYVRDRTPLRRGQISTAQLRDEFRRDPALPMLVGDTVFMRGIRKGIEQGDFVYKRNDLLCGPGDPFPTIMIDEQAVVFTMSFARDNSIWPRPAVQPISGSGATSGSSTAAGDPPPVGVGGSSGASGGSVGGIGGGSEGEPIGGASEPRQQPIIAPLSAEGVLREALVKLWEQARSRKLAKIEKLNIRLFDATDAFKLLGIVGAVKADKKTVKFDGGYETREKSTCEISFTGTPADAQPLKDFLEPQLRAAAEKSINAGFELSYEAGLDLSGDAPEKLTEQLTRFGAGAAYVEATAEGAS